MNIKKVLIVGSGILGQQIGFQCATHGFDTTMYDLRQESLDACRVPGKNEKRDQLTNADGSVDIYIGPKAPTGKEANWIATVPGKGLFATFRLYTARWSRGTTEAGGWVSPSW